MEVACAVDAGVRADMPAGRMRGAGSLFVCLFVLGTMGYVLVVACAVGAGVRADMAADRMCGPPTNPLCLFFVGCSLRDEFLLVIFGLGRAAQARWAPLAMLHSG